MTRPHRQSGAGRQTFTGGADPLQGRRYPAFNIPKVSSIAIPRSRSAVPDTGGVSPTACLGWTEGHFTRTGPVRDTDYMTVWVKEQGSWKVRADLGNTDPKTLSPEKNRALASAAFHSKENYFPPGGAGIAMSFSTASSAPSSVCPAGNLATCSM